MIHIKVITKQSILIILLVSNTINPLLALPIKSQTTIKRNQKNVGLLHEIKTNLINIGLEEDVALERTTKLLQTQYNTVERLKHFYKNSVLSISKEKLIKTLTQYALYEKDLNLNSYSSLIGFTQNILERPLNNEELEYIQNVS